MKPILSIALIMSISTIFLSLVFISVSAEIENCNMVIFHILQMDNFKNCIEANINNIENRTSTIELYNIEITERINEIENRTSTIERELGTNNTEVSR